MMPQWKGFTIHHSLTKDSGTVSWDAIRRYHVETKGWAAVGYHFGVELVGHSFEALIGRPLTWPGAHARGLNTKQIGICFVGDFDGYEPEKAMLAKAVTHIMVPLALGLVSLRQLGSTDHTFRNMITPHTAVAPWKTCPGEQFPIERLMTMFSDMMKEEMS